MTRMWMVNPKIMCKNHILGEHKEIHQLIGSLKRNFGVSGYVKNNCIEITSIVKRHDDIVNEMARRGYNHYSPINLTQDQINDISTYLCDEERLYKVDSDSSTQDLINRCDQCLENYKEVEHE